MNHFQRTTLKIGLGLGVMIVLAMYAVGSPALSATRCGKHTDIVKFLGEKYKEIRVGMGLINAGQMMELFISEQGSWTMLITRPDGVTCFGPVGKSWSSFKPKAEKPGEQL